MNRTLYKATLCLTTALGLGLAVPAYAQDNDSGVNDMADIVVTARRVEERLQDVPISITVFNQQELSNRNIVNAGDLVQYTPSLSANNQFGSDNTTFVIRGFVQDLGTAPSVGMYFADVVAPRGGTVATPSGDGAGAGSFFDLQNVQVLKGPQGTLQGRNTTGGSIMLVPQKPTSKLEGYVEGSLGNYNMQRLQGVINIPFGENFRMRLGVDRLSRDGYVINDGVDTLGNRIGPKDFSNTNYTAVRASFVADLTPDLENYTIVSHSLSKNNGSFEKLFATSGNGLTNPNFFEGLGYAQLNAQLGSGFYHARQDMANPGVRTKQWQVINTTTWKSSDTLTIKNIASYAQYQQDSANPLFGTNFTTPNMAAVADQLIQTQTGGNFNLAAVNAFGPNGDLTGYLNGLSNISLNFAAISPIPRAHSANQYTLTEELQFQGRSSDDKLNWQAGAYFESSRPLGLAGNQTQVGVHCTNLASIICSDPFGQMYTATANALVGLNNVLASVPGNPYGLSPMDPVAPIYTGSVNYNAFRNAYRDIGLYGQATYSLTDQLKLTGGFRYTWDRQNTQATLIAYHFPVGGGYIPTCVATNQVQTTPGQCTSDNVAKSHKPTWTVDLDYKPTDDILLYAKYSRGYRAGGVKPDAPTQFIVFQPEKIDTYELGLKSSWRGAVKGTFNLTGFYNKFANQQIQIGFNANQDSGLPPTAAPVNAGKSRMYGLEAELSLNPFQGLMLNAAYTYLNTKVQQIDTIVLDSDSPYTIQPQVMTGDSLVFSPKNKFTITGIYTLPLDESIGRISLGATFTHSDSMHGTYGDRNLPAPALIESNGTIVPTTADLGILKANNLLNLNVNWNSIAGLPVDLALFVTNVTKKKYYTHIFGELGGAAGAGFDTAALGEPRMIGARLKVHFGK